MFIRVPFHRPWENTKVGSSQSLVDGVFVCVKPAIAMHHWSSVTQQLLTSQATLLPVLLSFQAEAFLTGGLSCETPNWSAEHS